MMDEAVNRCHRHHGIAKDAVPLREGLIGRNQQTLALVTMGN